MFLASQIRPSSILSTNLLVAFRCIRRLCWDEDDRGESFDEPCISLRRKETRECDTLEVGGSEGPP